MSGPLDGVKVIEFTSVVLGPWACQILGDMGADIIKVEPPAGDTNRNLGPNRNNSDMSALFMTCNRNKRSIVLDLKKPEGQEVALKLAADADVMVHNFRPQAMVKLGLDFDAVKAVNPEIIYCATYGYSKNGPYGNKGALDDSIQAGSGIAMIMSMVEGEPRYLPTIIADKTTGMAVVNAVTAALFYKERHGKGQEIEVPMYETMVSFVMAEHQWGQTFEPAIGKAGYVRLMSEHRRPYKTKDGYIAVLPYWDNHWKTFCTIVERPDMLSDPRFKDMQSRLTNIGASYAETGKALFKKTTAEWLEILEPTNVPHMIVNTLDGLIDDPQLVESGFWQLHDHPTEGKIRMAKSPYNFSETPTDITRLPPRLGEQSEEILREAGYSDDEIYKMFELGVTKRPN
ncbi:MAG: CoA transferase [Kordiimonadaceae bacterium]|jgi:crotonobetainyl-CoA:carnitine CoA-transferase CaiB-like acyl-CoA transferase|nr:CoA transferase [Kordiimonadaceae bacterium]MBT6466099.1 CoA transferase [Kordiimonadaceae bacterium]MBT7605694.1 CoA transferase [Kordiimonadaceae bacterium]MDG1003909.1 CoA transferase [Emcibacteraceae bacterium]